jgi:hypothetical protein
VPNFSERIGASSPTVIQLESTNDPLRNTIWNFIDGVIAVNPRRSTTASIEFIGAHFCKFAYHKISTGSFYEARDWFWERYSELQWYRVYDLLEFVIENGPRFSENNTPSRLRERANELLEREVSGYRFIGGVIAPISDRTEVQAIREVMATADAVGLTGIKIHIETAVQLLGKKPDPDYRNSIKESISAVESAAKGITGVAHGGLDAALKQLDEKASIHPAFAGGLLKLYGYSSDEHGIRHAILEEPKVGFAEAKFMIVACSAAAHLLIAKADQSGLLTKRS